MGITHENASEFKLAILDPAILLRVVEFTFSDYPVISIGTEIIFKQDCSNRGVSVGGSSLGGGGGVLAISVGGSSVGRTEVTSTVGVGVGCEI